MSRQRVRALMRRLGARFGPLAHVATVGEYREAVARLGDAELLEEYRDAVRSWGESLSDDELLAELRKTQHEVAEAAATCRWITFTR